MLVGLVAFLSFYGCGTTETPVEEPVPAPAPAPEPPPEPAPAEPMAMTVDALGAAHDANAGKPVTVKGYYASMTKSDAGINVELNSTADLTGAKAGCVFPATSEAELTALAPKSEVTVAGTLSAEKAGDMEKIDGCAMAPAAGAAPTEGAAPGEGGAPAGKTGKGGKAKQKAH